MAQPADPPRDQAAAPERMGTFHAFRYRNYRLLWIGDLSTSAGMWIQQTVMGWVVYDLTGSGGTLGAVNLMRTIPILFFSAIAGVATERAPRNRIIAVSQLSMCVLSVLIAVDLMVGAIQVWHLFLFTFLIATAQTFNLPARQTFVFELVPRAVIPNAVALTWFAFSLARSIGPAVGGLLIVAFGPANNFLLQGFAYLLVMITVLLIRVDAAPRPASHKPFFESVREGYAFVLTEPRARLVLLMSLISPALIIPLHGALLPIFAKEVFHENAAGLGVLVGSIGFGGLFGGLLTASLHRVDRRGMLQMLALLVFSICETIFSILAWYTGNLWLAVPFLVVAGTAESLYTTTNTTMLQLLAPEHLRGSMASVLQLGFLVMPIGGMAAGASADAFGAPAVGAVMTFAAFAVGLAVLVLSPRMRELRLSHLTQEQTPTS